VGWGRYKSRTGRTMYYSMSRWQSTSTRNKGRNSHLMGAFTEGGQPIQLPCIMGLAHNTIWRNVLWPHIARVERRRVSVFSILPTPIKVNEHRMSLGRKVENVGISQVPKMHEGYATHCRYPSRQRQEQVFCLVGTAKRTSHRHGP